MGVRNIAVTLTGDSTSLGSALRSGARQVDTFANDVDRTNKRMLTSWQKVGAGIGATALVVATTLTGVGVAAAQFETRMRNVNSISGLSDQALGRLGGRVLDLSRQLPQSANDLAEGLYDVASSGFQGAEGLQVLEAAGEAASAGLTTTANSAQAITAVLNAYGLTASSAGDVSDALFQTVNLGVVSFEELTGVIGDVVGTAAAASVDINQVGAAVATMTLSGISASEAGTSLNRVLQSLLQPSEALTSVYEQLGIESGEQALKTKGLRGVMDELREATGGNVTQLLALFPEIRAARGALALMSNEGRNYANVSANIEDADKRQGATKRALAEQMKAAGAQFRLFLNDARATAIEVGSTLLPAFVALLSGVNELGDDAMPILESGLHAVSPLFRSLYDIGVDVVTILGTLVSVAGPAAGALLAIVGGPILAGLAALLGLVADVTGTLAEHRDIVLFLAAAYLVTLLPSIGAVTIAFNRMVLTPVVLGLAAVAGGAGGAAVALRGLAAAMLTTQAVMTAGLAVAAFGAARGYMALQDAQADATASTDKVRASFDALDSRKAQHQIDALRKTAGDSIEVGREYDSTWGTIRAGWNAFAGDGSVADVAEQGKAAAEAANQLQRQLDNTGKNLKSVALDTGLTVAELAGLAKAQDIDLSKPFAKGGEARRQLIGYVRDLERQTGVSAAGMASAVGMDIEAMDALGKAVQQVQDTVSKAFAGATDVVAGFDPEAGLAEQTSATEALEAATQRVADLKATQREKDKLSVADTQALRRANEEVADAQARATEAATARSTSTLRGYYRQTIDEARTFADGIDEVIRRGLDPAVVQRLLEAGPKAAAPLLEELTGSHAAKMIDLVNASERTLRDINATVVEQARLTALAVNATTDQNSRDLRTAMRISQQSLAANGKATAAEIGKAIGKPTAEVLRIAEAFGITIGRAMRRGVVSVPLTPKMREERYGGKYAQIPGGESGFAEGGLVTGPWRGPRADNVLARLTPREYVLPVAATEFYGTGFLEALRRRQVPRFADGGMVGARSSAVATSVLRVPLVESRTHQAPVYIDRVEGLRLDDVEAEAERRRDFTSSPGALGGW